MDRNDGVLHAILGAGAEFTDVQCFSTTKIGQLLQHLVRLRLEYFTGKHRFRSPPRWFGMPSSMSRSLCVHEPLYLHQ